ncbi:MAG: TMEM143 family protein [Solirubrobacteraceae bacterium]
MLSAEGRLAAAERDHFPVLARRLSALFHLEFHARLEALKDAYAPLARDPDTRAIRTFDDRERTAARRRLAGELQRLLDAANFEPVDGDELRRAFSEESLLELRLEVDFDDFDDLLVFHRGATVREERLSRWFGLRQRAVAFTNYEKVLLFVTFKDAEDFARRGRAVENLPFEPGSTLIKLFQDVPRADVEMLFPNAEVRMRPVDKLLIGVPALISGVLVLTTKLVATLGLLLLLLGVWLGLRDEPVELDEAALVTLGAGIGALGGYLGRQFNKFKNRKLDFMNTLARHLYFRNLDNDAGVFHHLLDSAEESEVKEALLGWHFLRTADRPLTIGQLDRAIEGWLADSWGCRLDFEADDSVAKLRRLGLVEQREGDTLTAVPIDVAIRRLDDRWARALVDGGSAAA